MSLVEIDGRLVFAAINQHVADVGEPPYIAAQFHSLSSYFESELGEQWLFTYDADTDLEIVQGGDLGWETLVDMRQIDDVVLEPTVRAWIAACHMAVNLRRVARR
jgi:hypothetical protein